ncbi:MAG TPA: polysaccharide deacetylase family protein [Candidatus Sulfotelmatobacter sp.]|nr:polysaccharide deacetylase family protein [Candidatus Sulfotelmatobacter sp.]
MNRRDFLRYSAATAALRATRRASGLSKTSPEIAFTFDDPKTDSDAGLTWREVNDRMLSALAKQNVKAILFVCGKRVDSAPGADLISEWNGTGHLIGSHSYSHLNFNESPDASNTGGVTLDQFQSDALKNEPLIRGYRNFRHLFRYPFFKEGDTAEKRDGMRSFLREHGYRIGRATIDASDWAIDARMTKKNNTAHADLTGYRDFYLEHIWQRAQYYDSLVSRLMLAPVRHTVLLHHNALNALFLSDLMAMFRSKGWTLVDAEYAYQDAIYDRQPKTLPAGESLVWALAKESGKFEKELRYPGEDDIYENPRMDALKL